MYSRVYPKFLCNNSTQASCYDLTYNKSDLLDNSQTENIDKNTPIPNIIKNKISHSNDQTIKF